MSTSSFCARLLADRPPPPAAVTFNRGAVASGSDDTVAGPSRRGVPRRVSASRTHASRIATATWDNGGRRGTFSIQRQARGKAHAKLHLVKIARSIRGRRTLRRAKAFFFPTLLARSTRSDQPNFRFTDLGVNAHESREMSPSSLSPSCCAYRSLRLCLATSSTTCTECSQQH